MTLTVLSSMLQNLSNSGCKELLSDALLSIPWICQEEQEELVAIITEEVWSFTPVDNANGQLDGSENEKTTKTR